MPKGAIEGTKEQKVIRNYAITSAQKMMLDRLAKITGKTETALVREAISQLIGGYREVFKQNEEA